MASKKTMYISNYNIDKSLFDGTWKLSKISDSKLKLQKVESVFEKRVTFSDNIEYKLIDTDVIEKDKMSNYGNSPTKIKRIIEEFLINILRKRYIVTSKYNLIYNLIENGLYYHFVKMTIDIYLSLVKNGRAMLYTQHTYVTNQQLDTLLEFINRDINIHIYTNRISRLFKYNTK